MPFRAALGKGQGWGAKGSGQGWGSAKNLGQALPCQGCSKRGWHLWNQLLGLSPG